MTLRAAAEQLTTIAAVRALNDCGCVTADDPSDAVLSALIDQASDVLAILSGMVVIGRAEVTVYPCRKQDHRQCGCGCYTDGIPLGNQDPVVSEVKVDGDIVDPSEYELHLDRMGWSLVRIGEPGVRLSWPSSQDLHLADTEDDTFSVTYTYGTHTGHIISAAANELVCDFVAEDVVKTNALPRGATSANMGGVQVGLGLSVQERLARINAGDLGPATSRFMSIYAPNGRRRSEVYAPELDTWSMTQKR